MNIITVKTIKTRYWIFQRLKFINVALPKITPERLFLFSLDYFKMLSDTKSVEVIFSH